jgi:hypothetical protein
MPGITVNPIVVVSVLFEIIVLFLIVASRLGLVMVPLRLKEGILGLVGRLLIIARVCPGEKCTLSLCACSETTRWFAFCPDNEISCGLFTVTFYRRLVFALC